MKFCGVKLQSFERNIGNNSILSTRLIPISDFILYRSAVKITGHVYLMLYDINWGFCVLFSKSQGYLNVRVHSIAEGRLFPCCNWWREEILSSSADDIILHVN